MEAGDAFERAKDPALACGEDRPPSKPSRAQRLAHPAWSAGMSLRQRLRDGLRQQGESDPTAGSEDCLFGIGG